MIDQNKQFIYLHAPLTNRANQCHDTIKTVFRNTFTSSKVLLVYDPHCTVVVKCPFPKALPPYTILGLCHTTCFLGFVMSWVSGQWSVPTQTWRETQLNLQQTHQGANVSLKQIMLCYEKLCYVMKIEPIIVIGI